MITVTYYEMTHNGNALYSAESKNAAWHIAFERYESILNELLIVEKTYEKEGEPTVIELDFPGSDSGVEPKVSWCEVDDSVYYDMFG